MEILKLSIRHVALHKLDFSAFEALRWQAIVGITLIGILVGLDPSLRAGTPEVPGMPLLVSIPFAALSVWCAFLVIVAILRWWMKRGQRWDGRGDLFNLVASSWFAVDVVGAGLIAMGIAPLWTLPLWLYSVWVGANALSGAIPKASVGYAIGGIVIGLIPAVLASGVVMGIAMLVAAGMGVVPAGPAA